MCRVPQAHGVFLLRTVTDSRCEIIDSSLLAHFPGERAPGDVCVSQPRPGPARVEGSGWLPGVFVCPG